MAHVEVEPDAVAGTASQIAAAGQLPASPTVTIGPAAPDPVSTAVAQTFTARMDGIAAYTAAAGAITADRATLLTATGADYRQQEAANATTLAGGSAPAAISPRMPVGSLPTLPPPSVAAPSIGAPPASGKAIAELIHSGSGATGLSAAAAQIRQHSADLSATAEQLASSANSLNHDWDSTAGREASSRITELGTWYESHATHASSLAVAVATHADNFGRVRTAVPPPEKFDDVERRLQMAITANKAPGSLGRYAPIIVALQTELAQLNGQAIQGYANYAASAADPSVTGDPLQPPRPSVQALDHDIPLTPPPADPPHGKDPRYWIDVTKIIHVPDGQLAPYGTVQIGPGLYYPDPSSGFNYTPPPGLAKYPLGIGDIVSTAPGQLGPSGHVSIAQTPQGSYWAPDPGAGYQPAPPWTAPQQPIDVRDVIRVPAGQLAPWGYVEYLPGWFVPGPQLTNTPGIPAPR